MSQAHDQVSATLEPLLDPSDILGMPIDSSRPNLQQKRRCETAYLSLYGNDEYQRSLFEIEQLV